ncbi:PsiF family protein [Inhella sp.]|uniref:PsiF family protein n=1 Tax=Inhella sp. TaxID=1921806 RepID=UPI0035B33096
MKIKALPLMLVFALAAGGAWAGPQQEKMKHCNAEAKTKNLAGEERKSFMSNCLKAKPEAPAAPATQQDRMKTCNADAKTKSLAGEERKKFMSNCLKAK